MQIVFSSMFLSILVFLVLSLHDLGPLPPLPSHIMPVAWGGKK